jgi:hypothetical protein
MDVQQPVLQSIYEPKLSDAPPDRLDSQQQQPQGSVELRFSFASSSSDDDRSLRTESVHLADSVQEWLSNTPRPDRVLNQSFSKLSFDGSQKARQDGPPSTSTTTARLPNIPEMAKPHKQREGYGFSFSDSMFYDSDEYPDTECGWDSGTEKDPGPRDLPAQATCYTPPAIAQDRSFGDMVVVRDVGSFHVARPQKHLPCTSATRDDTIKIKHTAKQLFKYKESPEIYSKLMDRLERMVSTSLRIPGDDGHSATTSHCALKLHDYLLRTKEWRVDTGELRVLVEHETDWATWLVEASRTGVMHLKGAGCKCRPEWEED